MKPRSRLPNIVPLCALLLAPASVLAQVPAAITGAVPESGDYQLIYQVAIPAVNEWSGSRDNINYSVDNSGSAIEFDRVAYVMELDAEWVWVSFDTFTTSLAEVGVPVVSVHPQPVQQLVENMNVFSNLNDAGRIQTGTGLTGGNIEFWGGNYAPSNALGIPNASDAAFDFGDTLSAGGHGCMQVHNHEASQVIFALNNWGSNNPGTAGGLGIGSQPSGEPDWTFSGSSSSYTTRNLYVLVREGAPPNLSIPELVRAQGSVNLDKAALIFNEPLAESSAALENFSIDGLAVTGAEVSGNAVILTTASQTAGATYAVSYTGVSDTEGNTIGTTKTTDFTTPTLPALIGTIPEISDYALIYHAEIPVAAPAWANGVPYTVDESLFSSATVFDRVGYLLALDSDWVFVSFNTISEASDLASIGVPTIATGAPFQRNVDSLDVFSNVPWFVTAGTGMTGGNIEFWPSNYGPGNALGVPNASDDLFDFGDGGASRVAGYGSMQVHNHEANGTGEVIFAFNRWGSFGGTTDIGIGTNWDGPNPDYTFSENAGLYATRDLFVLVRPGIKDTDGDGIPDTLEEVHGLDPNVADGDTDKDQDGLTAYVEIMERGTDPNDADTDDDDLKDGVETNTGTYVDASDTGTDPLDPDTDHDGLQDSAEVPGGDPGTSPVLGDTDGDYWADGTEVAAGTDPLDPDDHPASPVPAGITAAVSESGDYVPIYAVAIPAVNEWSGDAANINYNVDNSGSAIEFDRVAYVMELDGEWVWVSFDTFTSSLAGIGVPVVSIHPEPVQQLVENMNVFSNVNDAGRIQTGTGLTGGNIEFWGGNYAQGNALAIPNASDATFDFGDTMASGGHGSMQVHNHEASQVIFALNNWGSNNPGTPGGLGIGSQPTGEPDWTFSGSSANYTTRNLYVLVRQMEEAEVSLSISLTGGQITIEWQGGGTLEVASSVLGPWTAIEGAASGYTAPATETQAFYRVR